MTPISSPTFVPRHDHHPRSIESHVITGAPFLLECGPSNDYMVFCTAENFTVLCFADVIMHMDGTFWCLPITFLSSIHAFDDDKLVPLVYTIWFWYVHCSLPEGRGWCTATESLHSGERLWEQSPECYRHQLSKPATQRLSLSLLPGYSIVRCRHSVCVVIMTVSQTCVCKSDNWWHWHSFQFRAYFKFLNYLTTFLGLR